MVEVGIAEYFGMAEALGIIAAVFVVVYYSRKQMQALSTDIETKILNDLDEKLHGITEIGVRHPELIKIISNVKSDWTPEVAFSYHILYTLCAILVLYLELNTIQIIIYSQSCYFLVSIDTKIR